MRINRIVLCAALAFPFATMAAQRGRGGGGAAGGGGAPSERPASVGQIEDLNPARMLVDKRKKLSLADSTVNQLKALDKKISERNKPLLAQYDSVLREMRFPNRDAVPGAMAAGMGTGSKSRSGGGDAPGGGSPQSPEQVAMLRSQQQALASIGAQLRERRVTELAESLALLTADQGEKAKDFVNEQNDEFERVFPGRR